MLAASVRVSRNLIHRVLHDSDYRRWTNPKNLEAWWDARTAQLARLVPPGSRVIEFGAGRCQLEKLLDSTCSYVPSDLVGRGPGTLVCDLNHRPLPDLSGLDVDTAVFGGVLEYIHDVEFLLAWLAQHVVVCVASYSHVRPAQGPLQTIRERFTRRYYGFMNAYSEEELLVLFRRAGFVCQARDTWTSQRLFRFVKQRVNSEEHFQPESNQ